MSKSGSIFLAMLALLCTACGGPALTCDSPQAYQASIEVEKVRSPDGLDTLMVGKEMDIPRASPQDPRPPGSPCLDLPPTVASAALRRAARADPDDDEAEADDEAAEADAAETGDDDGGS